MAVIPQGQFHGPMPEDLVMTCTATDVSTGEVIGNVPILIAPPTERNWPACRPWDSRAEFAAGRSAVTGWQQRSERLDG
jgi:hypothetical protein